METLKSYHFFACGVMLLLLLGFAHISAAQQSDTTQTEQKIKLKQKSLQPYHSERSANGFLLSNSGTYDVPEPTEYYKPPFTGRESLERAMEAYRKELENSVANTPLFQFFKMIAPFVNNRFEFGVYRINDMPLVDRDNPLLTPQIKNKEEKEN